MMNEQPAAASKAFHFSSEAAWRGLAVEFRNPSVELELEQVLDGDSETAKLLLGELRRLRTAWRYPALATEKKAADAEADAHRGSEDQRRLDELASRIFALPTQMSNFQRPLDHGDPRRLWLEQHFMASFRPQRGLRDSHHWHPRAEVDVLEIFEVNRPKMTALYLHELNRIRSQLHPEAHDDVCGFVPELANALRPRSFFATRGWPDLNEALLFHGCDRAGLREILARGFHPSLGGANAGYAFGYGSYFTTAAHKADYYTDLLPNKDYPEWGHYRAMLVARVALGRVAEMRSRKPKLQQPPKHYDSTLGVPAERGGCMDYDEFVVYRQARALPAFVILYRHIPRCHCRTCAEPR
eukprot:TRINITY_DN33361_c0_g1_i1.p1 TRINITY_DN33361_c0_g1~~TRINITY_DN33361_c0_g1_i1.p1  ORF type:complete len:355 (+),score=73.11 TRINITY_DN33361_c0_g1_i1:81-1145(+)